MSNFILLARGKCSFAAGKKRMKQVKVKCHPWRIFVSLRHRKTMKDPNQMGQGRRPSFVPKGWPRGSTFLGWTREKHLNFLQEADVGPEGDTNLGDITVKSTTDWIQENSISLGKDPGKTQTHITTKITVRCARFRVERWNDYLVDAY